MKLKVPDMSPGWLFSIEGLIIAGLFIGWAVYELRDYRNYKKRQEQLSREYVEDQKRYEAKVESLRKTGNRSV